MARFCCCNCSTSHGPSVQATISRWWSARQPRSIAMESDSSRRSRRFDGWGSLPVYDETGVRAAELRLRPPAARRAAAIRVAWQGSVGLQAWIGVRGGYGKPHKLLPLLEFETRGAARRKPCDSAYSDLTSIPPRFLHARLPAWSRSMGPCSSRRLFARPGWLATPTRFTRSAPVQREPMGELPPPGRSSAIPRGEAGHRCSAGTLTQTARVQLPPLRVFRRHRDTPVSRRKSASGRPRPQIGWSRNCAIRPARARRGRRHRRAAEVR